MEFWIASAIFLDMIQNIKTDKNSNEHFYRNTLFSLSLFFYHFVFPLDNFYLKMGLAN